MILKERISEEISNVFAISPNEVDLEIGSHYGETRLIKGSFLKDDKKNFFRGRFLDSRQAKKVFDLSTYLFSSGFDQGPVRIPRPLYHSSSNNFFIYEEVVGKTFFDLVEYHKLNQVEINNVIEKIAQGIAKLHKLLAKIDLGKTFIKDQLSVLDTGLAKMERQNKEEAKRYRNLYDKLIKTSKGMTNDFCQVIHADFQATNIVVDSQLGFIVILDFERSFLGDPAFDVGTFLGYTSLMLSYHFGSDYSRQSLNLFINKYLANIKDEDFASNLVLRSKFYQNFTYFYIINFILNSPLTIDHRKTIKSILNKIESNAGT